MILKLKHEDVNYRGQRRTPKGGGGYILVNVARWPQKNAGKLKHRSLL